MLKKPSDPLSVDDARTVLEIYKMLVDMADKVSQRRQNCNSFYLSVNTALVGASAYISAAAQSTGNSGGLSVAGLAVSLLWARNIQSYKELNSGKFAGCT
jgi:hypothetical protein